MKFTKRLAAAIACAALLLGSATTAHADDTSPTPAPVEATQADQPSTDAPDTSTEAPADPAETTAPETAPAPEPVTISLSLRGKATELRTNATTVAGLLTERQITLTQYDRLSVRTETVITAGLRVAIDQVKTTEVSTTKVIQKKVVKKKTRKLPKGKRKTRTKGRNGTAVDTHLVTTVNGVVKSRVLASTVITVKPRKKVVLVGTGPKLNLARFKMWNKIAKCESGRRWHINTHNGYYGGLQFSLSTWRSVKGHQFAKYPHKATRAQQITVANRLYKRSGLRPWACKP